MKPLWLELMLTPMAAPETRGLRRLRWTWQGLCLALAAAVAGFPWLRSVAGTMVAIGVAALLAAALGVGGLYWWRKQRADAAHLDAAVGGGA